MGVDRHLMSTNEIPLSSYQRLCHQLILQREDYQLAVFLLMLLLVMNHSLSPSTLHYYIDLVDVLLSEMNSRNTLPSSSPLSILYHYYNQLSFFFRLYLNDFVNIQTQLGRWRKEDQLLFHLLNTFQQPSFQNLSIPMEMGTDVLFYSCLQSYAYYRSVSFVFFLENA